MTINIARLRAKVADLFPDVEQVADSVIRFTKRVGDQPYSVYYFDIAQNLPNSQETLAKYQDQIIGSHYFEGKKSLQWSNYLYFITDRDRLKIPEVFNAKELIERDRAYARKFVISEEELEQVLVPPVITAAEDTPQVSVLSTWSEQLANADLHKAIFSDDDLPTRLKLIEDSSDCTIISKVIKDDSEKIIQPFIRSLHIEKFREFPEQRKFNFGAVNLIFGRNGSGKTSLLEAIELFYCGRHKRNPKTRPSYSFAVEYADGNSETATNQRKIQIFRDRNLMWYGQPDIKTNNLYQSFSQFNFLDTDAATDLADSTSRIEDDLSRLLVGSETSKVWRNIERVTDEVAKKLKSLSPLKTQINDELNRLEKLLLESSDIPQESDSIRARLYTMLDRVGWSLNQSNQETFTERLLESLTELIPVAQQATKIRWTESPVTMEAMKKYCRDIKLKIDKADTDLIQLKNLHKEQRDIETALNGEQQALDMAKQIKRFVEADVLGRVEEHGKLHAKIATLSGQLVGFDLKFLDALATVGSEESIADFHGKVALKQSTTIASIADTKKEYDKFCELRDQSLNLAQQLREIANRILRSSSKPDECPLCHNQFESGELQKHIDVGVDENMEKTGQEILKQLREKEAMLHDIEKNIMASHWVMEFCKRSKLAVKMPTHLILDEVDDTRRLLIKSKERFKVIDSEVQYFDSQGLSIEKLEMVKGRLCDLGYSIEIFSEEEVARLLLKIKRNTEVFSKKLSDNKNESEVLRRDLAEALEEKKDPESKLSQLRERVAEVEVLQERLGQFSSLFPWPMGKPLVELLVEAESIRNVAADLQAALGKEEKAKAIYAESISREKHLKKQLAELDPQIDRFNNAYSMLKKLQEQYSLHGAMEASLEENRAAIETIFSQIHSPTEFRGLGADWSTLIRKVDDRESKLSEISTGQRAAFALSVFLAQNAKLNVAPPVILIDDPIAHVDDMNSLSFLDYLREIALQGKRQIFFATASNKLASLFERKFDFLGSNKFRRFNLSRNT